MRRRHFFIYNKKEYLERAVRIGGGQELLMERIRRLEGP